MVDAAVVSEHEEQEKSVLLCCRMYLFRRIVRGMLRMLDSLMVIAESICRAVGRQLHGGGV